MDHQAEGIFHSGKNEMDIFSYSPLDVKIINSSNKYEIYIFKISEMI